MKNPLIAVTMGDPGGVGPEVVVKALRTEGRRPQCRYLILGSYPVFESLRRRHRLALPPHEIVTKPEKESLKSKIRFMDISDSAGRMLHPGCLPTQEPEFAVGRVSARNGALALAAVSEAARLAALGTVQAVVTAPISKTAIRALRPDFTGHTEYLAARAGCRRFAMMFVSPRLCVTLVTIHIPIRAVPRSVTLASVTEKIDLTDRFLKRYLKISNPRIGVCALNPHGHETGHEEKRVLEPAVRKMKNRHIRVSGPYSADRLFYDAYHGRFDALISMYHDQALGPFKLVAFHDGVNVTLGLPYVRTSPDHGTAFDLAGRAEASSQSMTEAIRRAREWALAGS